MLSFYFQLLHVEHFHLASLSIPSLSSSLPWRDFARCKICIFWPALFFSPFFFCSFLFLLSYWQSNAIYTPRLRVSGLATLYWPDLFANFCAPMWKTLLAYSPFFPASPTPQQACKIVFPFCHFPPPPRANSLTHVRGGLLLLIFWIVVSKREKKCWAISMINVFGSVRFGFVNKIKKKNNKKQKQILNISHRCRGGASFEC